MRVLIVEDDYDLRFLYRTALTQKGYEVVDAENATVAEYELDADTFDLILLDLNMPDKLGTAVIDHMRADKRHLHTQVIVITANDHWVDKVLERGVDNILVKPVSINQILATVQEILS